MMVKMTTIESEVSRNGLRKMVVDGRGSGEPRPRRLRQTAGLRALVAEVEVTPRNLVMPLFIREGTAIKEKIESMPGLFRLSPDEMLDIEIGEILSAGIGSVLLFGLPSKKDPVGSGAYGDQGVVQQAVRRIKRQYPEMVVICDVCMCEYTDHGHCGILDTAGRVLNDETNEYLARIAVSQAKAGADIVAPSAMMDNQVLATRRALDESDLKETAIMAYSTKYASSFYGPFREAAGSTPKFGDRKSYQMDSSNIREALRETRIDVQQGADILMVKPALSYLDVVRMVRENFDLPLAAYNVSGEYSMIKAASANGWLDEKKVVEESLRSIKRAGADIIITYFAKDFGMRWKENISHKQQ
jgi:porphobilinogen synthase